MTTTINDERKPLISTENDDPPAPDSTTVEVVETPSCRWQTCFLVEPILVMFALGMFPLYIVKQKYTLDWFSENTSNIFVGRNSSGGDSNTTTPSCHANSSGADYEFQQLVQSEASQFSLYESLVVGIPATFITVFLGAGSDHFGRRFAIIPPIFGTFAGSLISTVVMLTKSHLYWFFLADFIGGCTGSFLSILMACFAYVADKTSPDRRLFRILVIEMSFLISGIVSPIVNGVILDKFGYFYPLTFATLSSALNLIYVAIFFPRNTRPRQYHTFTTSSGSMSCVSTLSTFFAVIWKHVCVMFNIFLKSSDPSDKTSSWRRLKLNLLMVAFFITNLPTFDVAVSTLFQMNSPLCWNMNTIGLFMGLSAGVSGVGALIVTPLFKFCHTSDIVIAIISSFASFVSSVYTSLVTNTVMMFLSESNNKL